MMIIRQEGRQTIISYGKRTYSLVKLTEPDSKLEKYSSEAAAMYAKVALDILGGAAYELADITDGASAPCGQYRNLEEAKRAIRSNQTQIKKLPSLG